MAQVGAAGAAAPGAMDTRGALSGALSLGIVALILNLIVLGFSAAGFHLFIPFNIIGGFSFNIGLAPVMTALTVALALWRYGGLSQGRAWFAAVLVFAVPIVVSFIVNYGTGVALQLLPDSVVTNATNFYGILFLKGAFSAASVLIVVLYFAPPFRDWTVWVGLIVIWAGGDTLLFMLFRNQAITREVYQSLYPLERMLGFMLIAWQLHRPAPRA
jgi:hypothetical protein